MGSRAGQYYEAGDENVIVGYDAGFYNTDGDQDQRRHDGPGDFNCRVVVKIGGLVAF